MNRRDLLNLLDIFLYRVDFRISEVTGSIDSILKEKSLSFADKFKKEAQLKNLNTVLRSEIELRDAIKNEVSKQVKRCDLRKDKSMSRKDRFLFLLRSFEKKKEHFKFHL